MSLGSTDNPSGEYADTLESFSLGRGAPRPVLELLVPLQLDCCLPPPTSSCVRSSGGVGESEGSEPS